MLNFHCGVISAWCCCAVSNQQIRAYPCVEKQQQRSFFSPWRCVFPLVPEREQTCKVWYERTYQVPTCIHGPRLHMSALMDRNVHLAAGQADMPRPDQEMRSLDLFCVFQHVDVASAHPAENLPSVQLSSAQFSSAQFKWLNSSQRVIENVLHNITPVILVKK